MRHRTFSRSATQFDRAECCFLYCITQPVERSEKDAKRRRGEGGREIGVRDSAILFPLPCPFPSSTALHRIAMHLLLLTSPFSIALHTVLSVHLNYVAFPLPPLPSLPFAFPYHPSFLDSLPSLLYDFTLIRIYVSLCFSFSLPS